MRIIYVRNMQLSNVFVRLICFDMKHDYAKIHQMLLYS